MRVAYCTGFWCTNIGNGFFSMGVEYTLKKILGEKNVTVVSDIQTYTTGYGRRLYPHKNQIEYISLLDVDYIVLAGPVISKYFLLLWKDILLKLKKRGVGYMILSAGIMKLDADAKRGVEEFFSECPPYILCSRDSEVYGTFGKYARYAYDGICFSFFAPDFYSPCGIDKDNRFIVCNFDKINEPDIWEGNISKKHNVEFDFGGRRFCVDSPYSSASKTDRFTDAFIYAKSVLPAHKRPNVVCGYNIIRTDQRFHPHYRGKIYRHGNSFCADIPYGYLNIYANSELTLSDRVHACAVTLAFGHSAMLFINTGRAELFERVGAGEIMKKPVCLDIGKLTDEKNRMTEWLKKIMLAI